MTANSPGEPPRPAWAVDSTQYSQQRRAPAKAMEDRRATLPLRPPTDLAAAQRELTGVSWRIEEVDLDLIPRRPTDQARARFRAALPDLVWNAAALEGNTITLPEVRTLLDGTTVAGHRIEEEEQVLALAEAYNALDELVGRGGFRIDKATSNLLHGIVARHEAIESGAFRGFATGGGSVRLASGGIVEGVPTSEHPRRWALLMDYLADRSADMTDARVRALVYSAAATRAQFYFDGNKRTARLMMAGELMSSGFDAVSIPHSRLLEYNLALDELFTTDDATSLMRFTATCAPRS